MDHKHCLELLECGYILLYIFCAAITWFFFKSEGGMELCLLTAAWNLLLYGCVIIIAVLFLPSGLFQDRKRQAELAKLQMTSQKQQSVLKRKVEEVQCDFLDLGV